VQSLPGIDAYWFEVGLIRPAMASDFDERIESTATGNIPIPSKRICVPELMIGSCNGSEHGEFASFFFFNFVAA